MQFVTLWRGQKDTPGRRRFWRWLLVSAVLHLPVSPLAAWVGLIRWFGAPSVALPPQDLNEITAIPVELVAPAGPLAGEAETPKPSEEPAPSEPPAPAERRAERVALHVDRDRDAGADGLPDAAAEDAGAADAEPGDADAGDGGMGPKLPNPIALAGAAGAIADSHAPVSIAVYMQNIRKHPLGEKVGQILGRVYQWRDFFGPAALDPVRDIDRMLIAGPEFNDSSRVVAVLRYRVADATMKSALDRIVKARSGGKWLEGKVPAALATADRAARLFVMPAPHVMVIAPTSAKKSALALPRTLSQKRDPFPGPRGDEVMVAYLVAPWAAFAQARVPLKVPPSIKSATFVLKPSEAGGLVANVEAEDESPEAARQHAEELTQAVRAATRVGRGIFRFSVLERVRFWAEGKLIRGEAVATADQVALALAIIEPMVTPPEAPPPVLPSMSPPAASARPLAPASSRSELGVPSELPSSTPAPVPTAEPPPSAAASPELP